LRFVNYENKGVIIIIIIIIISLRFTYSLVNRPAVQLSNFGQM